MHGKPKYVALHVVCENPLCNCYNQVFNIFGVASADVELTFAFWGQGAEDNSADVCPECGVFGILYQELPTEAIIPNGVFYHDPA